MPLKLWVGISVDYIHTHAYLRDTWRAITSQTLDVAGIAVLHENCGIEKIYQVFI